jgi:hypothetical protein
MESRDIARPMQRETILILANLFQYLPFYLPQPAL